MAVRPSRLPLWLALITFGLSLVSGGYAYSRFLRTVPALVAVRDVPAGTALAPELVRVIRVPAGGVPPLALYGPGQIAGQYTAVPLFAEQIITARHLTAEPPVKDPLAELGPGQRVISVPVRPEAVLGGAMRPGDLVDVAAAWPGQDAKPGPVEVLVTGVKVIDIRNASATPAAGDKSRDETAPDAAVPASVLLLVNSQQARALVGAVESKAAIYLWLAGRDRS